jgi:hypothetical protein
MARSGVVAVVDPQFVGGQVVRALLDRHADHRQHRTVEPLRGLQVLHPEMQMIDQPAAMLFHEALRREPCSNAVCRHGFRGA